MPPMATPPLRISVLHDQGGAGPTTTGDANPKKPTSRSTRLECQRSFATTRLETETKNGPPELRIGTRLLLRNCRVAWLRGRTPPPTSCF